MMLGMNGGTQQAVATAIGHHGEILQGAFRDQDGSICRGLTTLAFPYFNSMAVVTRTNAKGVKMKDPKRTKSLQAAQISIEQGQERAPGLEVDLFSNIPVGFGLGSSTADVVAVIRACSKLLQIKLNGDEVFRLAVDVERASDGTMFNGPARLVAHREGRVLEKFDGRLPSFGLISINVAPQDPVDTLTFKPARYTTDQIDEFMDLRDLLRRAIEQNDEELLGKVATRSAKINQQFLPQPGFEHILEIVQKYKALGVQVAHSGRVVGIMVSHHRSKKRVKKLVGAIRELGVLPTYFPLGLPALNGAMS